VVIDTARRQAAIGGESHICTLVVICHLQRPQLAELPPSTSDAF
jgi:hypothetical protein